MKMSRTLLTSGVFALLAMIYVPTPRGGYRLIFSSGDTSIAFFQLLVNVAFAALLGAILAIILAKLATILAKVPKRALYATAACIAVVALGLEVFAFCEAAIDRAQRDEKNGEEVLVLYPTELQWTLTKFRNAASNWRLALRFDEATRVENRIKELQKHAAQDWRSDPVVDLSGLPDQAPEASARGKPVPTPAKYISTDPNAGEPIPRVRPVKKSMLEFPSQAT
jgi:hypothetical protein